MTTGKRRRRGKGKGENGDEPPRVDKNGRERAVHLEIIARRQGGGPPPTPEAYARAIEQWRQLPGAVVHVPVSDVAAAKPTPVPTDVDAEGPKGSEEPQNDEPSDRKG